MIFFFIITKGFFNGRNCKYCFDEIVFYKKKSEVIVNWILIVSIVINEICFI